MVKEKKKRSKAKRKRKSSTWERGNRREKKEEDQKETLREREWETWSLVEMSPCSRKERGKNRLLFPSAPVAKNRTCERMDEGRERRKI
jgi:hypothetical protein